MTDIEQRAHDLAVSYAQAEIMKIQQIKFNQSTAFEYAKIYLSYYRLILKSLQEELLTNS